MEYLKGIYTTEGGKPVSPKVAYEGARAGLELVYSVFEAGGFAKPDFTDANKLHTMSYQLMTNVIGEETATKVLTELREDSPLSPHLEKLNETQEALVEHHALLYHAMKTVPADQITKALYV